MNFKKGEYKKLKQTVWERDNWTCAYCGLYMKDLYEEWQRTRLDKWTPQKMKRKDAKVTVDHIIPRSAPHTYKITTLENLTTCCYDCNQKKGGRETKNKYLTYK